MSCRVRQARDGGNSLVTVSGEIDLDTAPKLRTALQAAVAGGGPVVVDLGGVTFMDSAGFGALVAAHQQARRAGTELRLRNVSTRIQQLLGVLGLDTLLTIEPPTDPTRIAG